jgi:hypothetical protein
MHLRRSVVTIIALAVAALVVTACGGGGITGGTPSIKDARSCLKDAKLTVSGPQGADSGTVEDGVSATGGIGDGMLDPSKPLTIVVAANVKKDSDVKSFIKESESFSDKLTAEQRKTFSVRSGHDDRYVWVVAGDKSSTTFQAAEKCVKP